MGEPPGLEEEERSINKHISLILGRSVYDLYACEDEELQAFRRAAVRVVREAVRVRQQCGASSLANYHFPPELEGSANLPSAVSRKLNDGYLTVTVRRARIPITNTPGPITTTTTTTTTITLRVTWDVYPEGVVARALKRLPPQPTPSPPSPHPSAPSNYVLKIYGSQEYLLAARPITQYKTVQFLISHGKTPEFCLISKQDLHSSLHPFHFKDPSYCTSSTSPATPDAPVSLWHPSLEGRLRVHVMRASGAVSKDIHRMFVCAGVFHGEEPLCAVRETGHSSPGCRREWGEWILFDLPIQELPRGARLCLGVWCQRANPDKRRIWDKSEEAMVGWANLNLFDFRGRLVHGRVQVGLQPPPKGCEDRLNPLGHTGYSRVGGGGAAGGGDVEEPSLEVEFEKRFSERVVLYPDTGQMEDYASYITKLERGQAPSPPVPSAHSPITTASIAEVAHHDPLIPLEAGVKEELWRGRQGCVGVPDSLPCLVEAVRWSCRDQVSQLYLLMKEWPPISPEAALELLSGKSTDPSVRYLAVRHLDRSLSDETFLQYMLQLVQSLKREVYLDSPLMSLLLRRALCNAKLGHFLFWHLRAEMDVWPNPLHVLATLEAFCRGLDLSGLKGLSRQVEAVERMGQLAEMVKDRHDNCKKTEYLKEKLHEAEVSTSLQHLPSLLHPSLPLGRLRIADCRVIESARCPLHLAWYSPVDSTPHPPAIIFKSGDDLRQDMLCLQVMTLMAQLWTQEGLELSMVPYSCLATSRDKGLIEVVEGAETVYNIQRVSTLGAIQVDSSKLYKWVKTQNRSACKLEQAISNFTRSCAAYCVATFVLGIGDRHPSNIMVNRDGLIFHIDFGHILGNFKKKFGIPRERVPFVLTSDFLVVIAKGAENPKDSQEFQRFQQLCGKAYLALRHHYRLLVILFGQLVNTGMPEVQSTEDVAYLRKTLAVGVPEEEALQYFQNRFHEAYDGAWTTKLDWFFHCVRHR